MVSETRHRAELPPERPDLVWISREVHNHAVVVQAGGEFGSAGLALLAKHAARCAELGSRFLVVADHPAVLRPITVTGLGQLVDVVASIDQAGLP